MKKLVTFILILCMLLSISACADKEGTAPETSAPETNAPETSAPETEATEITIQEIYDSAKNLPALLGDHESVYVQVVSNGALLREEYLNKEYIYSFYDAEYLDYGYEYADFTTDHSMYAYFDSIYSFNISLTPNGVGDMKDLFDETADNDFISSAILNDTVTITEENGSIIVTCIADINDLLLMGDGVVSCVETYTLDAATREMTSVKTVYTYEDGTVEEGIATITRDVEAPERVNAFLAYEQGDVEMRTITIVYNAGTEDEMTETVQAPKGLDIIFTAPWSSDETVVMYTDADFTHLYDYLDTTSDVTLYAAWEPISYIDENYIERIDEYAVALIDQWDESAYFDNEMSSLMAYYYEGNALDNVGFAFMDLDGDSSDELIIGAIHNAENSPLVFEIWTLKDGEAVMLAQSGSRNRYYMQYAEEDGVWSIAYEAENGAANHAVYYLQMVDGELEVIQGVVFDAVANETDPWFMAYDLDWDVSNDTPIDEDTANAVIEAERNIYAAVEYVPYSMYY